MFQFRRFPTYGYLIYHTLTVSSTAGFPHSEIRGSLASFASPRLIVDRYVLRRLPMPRHSPYALLRLNYLQQFDLLLLVLASCKNCCAHTFAVLMAKLFFPIAISEKPDFLRVSPHYSCFPYFSVMYVSHAFFRIHMIRYFLIRFSMNIRPFGFHEHLNSHSGARQTRTSQHRYTLQNSAC